MQVNAELIPAQSSGSPTGASYRLVDRGVLLVKTYHYYLELIRLDGHRGRLGPVSVRVKRPVVVDTNRVKKVWHKPKGLIRRRFRFEG